MQSGEGKKQSIVEHILQGELVKFTSVDFDDAGAQPLTAAELGPQPQPPPAVATDGDFIDPRAWADDQPAMDAAELRALESRRTSRDAPVAPAPAPAARRAAERMRVPTGENRAPLRNSPPVASPAESTPGPEALASVLEPTPGPQSPQARAAAAAPRTVQEPSHAGRNFLIGAVIGIVLIGAAAAVYISQHGGLGGHSSPPAQPAS
jgi:hypothetical protein